MSLTCSQLGYRCDLIWSISRIGVSKIFEKKKENRSMRSSETFWFVIMIFRVNQILCYIRNANVSWDEFSSWFDRKSKVLIRKTQLLLMLFFQLLPFHWYRRLFHLYFCWWIASNIKYVNWILIDTSVTVVLREEEKIKTLEWNILFISLRICWINFKIWALHSWLINTSGIIERSIYP